jgi:hypothetical protein
MRAWQKWESGKGVPFALLELNFKRDFSIKNKITAKLYEI